MRCRRAGSHLDALYRIFVQPSIINRASPPRNALSSQLPALNYGRHQSPAPQLHNAFAAQKRTIYRGSRGRKVPEPIKRLPQNDEIESPIVNFVDQEQKFNASVEFEPLLYSTDLNVFALVQVSEGNASLPSDDPQRWPTVKMTETKKLRLAMAEKEKLARAQLKPQKTGKTVQVSWQADEHDAAHRLDKAKRFLEEGKKVEVMLVHKKRAKREMDEDDYEDVVHKIRSVLSSIPGVREVKTEGTPGTEMILFFQNEKIKS